MATAVPAGTPDDVVCFIKQLPDRLVDTACQTAKDIFAANAPGNYRLPEGVLAPQQLAVLTSKYWGPAPRTLSVRFMEPQWAPPELQQRILSHMNAWGCSITFALAAPGQPADVRISLTGQGYWSYLGTDILHVPESQVMPEGLRGPSKVQRIKCAVGPPTMNLQGFNMSTLESEFRRVVRHETGHTLGFPHEHLRRQLVDNIDPGRAYAYFRDHYGWPPEMVNSNVLVPLEESSILGTPVDVLSVMCYELPSQIMKDNRPGVPGGNDITWSDFNFCQRMYPRPGGELMSAPAVRAPAVRAVVTADWGPAHDVDINARKRKFCCCSREAIGN